MNDEERQVQAEMLDGLRQRAPFASERQLLNVLTQLWHNRRRVIEHPDVLEGLDEAMDVLVVEWQSRGALEDALADYLAQVVGPHDPLTWSSDPTTR